MQCFNLFLYVEIEMKVLAKALGEPFRQPFKEAWDLYGTKLQNQALGKSGGKSSNCKSDIPAHVSWMWEGIFVAINCPDRKYCNKLREQSLPSLFVDLNGSPLEISDPLPLILDQSWSPLLHILGCRLKT